MDSALSAQYSVLSWADLPIVDLPFAAAGAHHAAPVLNLDATLSSGQAFRWRQTGGAWIGVVGNRVVRIWEEATGAIQAQMYPGNIARRRPEGRANRSVGAAFRPPSPSDSPEATLELLGDYFRANVDLRGWATVAVHQHPLLAAALGRFFGLRVLSQNPTEVLLAFAGATARSVEMITRSIELLADRLGQPIAELDGVSYHAFPTASAIAAASSDELARGCRLFYRGATVQRAARILVERGDEWLHGLADGPYVQAHRELMAIPGIGPKVADCVCLFGLRFDEAVPIDAHVWRLAQIIFPGEIPTRTLTPTTYAIVAGLFRRRFGRMAGWAQQYLFHARRMLDRR